MSGLHYPALPSFNSFRIGVPESKAIIEIRTNMQIFINIFKLLKFHILSDNFINLRITTEQRILLSFI